MPARAHFLRQLHLVRRLQAVRERALPFEEIQRYLLQETSVGDFDSGYSKRTLQRDVREIIDLFGITIKTRKNEGYYIADTEPLPAGWQQLFEAVELQEFLRLPAALAPFVQPEMRQPLGLEHLRPLLRAAQAGQVVEFQYLKHWEDEAETRTVGPLLLKEFRGRWYVLAVMVWSGHLACFGLGRIRELRVTSEKFSPPAGFDAGSYYAEAFGITRPHDAAPQDVVLSFTAQQGRYALSYPLHTSQRVLLQTDSEIRLGLRVFLTHELYMELLSYGTEVEVLAPTALRAWVRAGHAEAIGGS